jgi:hypothetical protein
MEKRLCLTLFWIVLPVCGAGRLCLLDIFASLVAFFPPQMIARLIYSLSTGDDRSTI